MNVAAADLTNVVRIRIYCENAVDGVRVNGTPVQIETKDGGAEATLTTALMGGDSIIFYAVGGTKIVEVNAPRG